MHVPRATRVCGPRVGLRRPRAAPQDPWPLCAHLHHRDQTHHRQQEAEGRRSRVVTSCEVPLTAVAPRQAAARTDARASLPLARVAVGSVGNGLTRRAL
eukprot:scaffold28790_cov59-Phaeocystis_antarctica.AAC.4